jgi:glutamine---fructose-6-phosphate transaminase (isomerizing)
MTTALSRMIHSQSAAVEAIAGQDLAKQADLLGNANRVWLIGTGTSQHAAELGADLLQHAGLDARWEPAVHFAHRTAALKAGDVAVIFSHTAQTAYAQRARAAVIGSPADLITITGRDRGWPEAFETPTHEDSETYTASYTAALAVLAVLGHNLGLPGLSPAELRRTAERMRAAAANPEIDHVGVPARAMAILGAGPWSITAREGALKIREAARILCEGFDPELLLHGPAVPYTSADTLLVLQPGADPDELTRGLADAARKEGLTVVVLDDPEPPASPFLAQLPMTVRLQSLAERFARLRAMNPDVAITGAWAEDRLWRLGSPAAAGDAAARADGSAGGAPGERP